MKETAAGLRSDPWAPARRRDPAPPDGQMTRETVYRGAETVPVLTGGGFTVCTYMKSQN